MPKQTGMAGYLTEIIELFAGKEHYKNYKNFMQNGGIYSLANKAGLKIIDEKRTQSSSNHIVILQAK